MIYPREILFVRGLFKAGFEGSVAVILPKFLSSDSSSRII